jgi:hypothetical protein
MASMAGSKPVLLVANGDLRLRANQMCWPAQAAMEPRLDAAVAACAGVIQRAHPTDPAEGHDFIASQKQGVAVFAGLDPEAPLIVVEAVAILAPCAGRTHHPSRPDPASRELVCPVGRAGRPSQREYQKPGALRRELDRPVAEASVQHCGPDLQHTMGALG